jgi:hypothetical protein
MRPAWSLPALAEPPRPGGKWPAARLGDAVEERAEELVRLEVDSVRNCCGRHCYVLRLAVS